jgi:hypothetical protein
MRVECTTLAPEASLATRKLRSISSAMMRERRGRFAGYSGMPASLSPA